MLRGRVFPSPEQWRDQIFYQGLPDQFSDGREAARPLFDHNHSELCPPTCQAIPPHSVILFLTYFIPDLD